MANYDNQPSVFEAVGNGSFLYRYDIQEVAPETIEGEGEGQAQEQDQPQKSHWECKEVLVWAPVTANKITKAVIAGEYDSDREQKLVNEYNGAQLGLYGAKTSAEAKEKIQAYTEFLERRNVLKTQVDADCAQLGIK